MYFLMNVSTGTTLPIFYSQAGRNVKKFGIKRYCIRDGDIDHSTKAGVGGVKGAQLRLRSVIEFYGLSFGIGGWPTSPRRI